MEVKVPYGVQWELRSVSHSFTKGELVASIPSPHGKRWDSWAIASSLQKARWHLTCPKWTSWLPRAQVFYSKIQVLTRNDKVLSPRSPAAVLPETLFTTQEGKRRFVFRSQGSWFRRWVIMSIFHFCLHWHCRAQASAVTDPCILPLQGFTGRCWVWKDKWRNTKCDLSVEVPMFAYFTRHPPFDNTREMNSTMRDSRKLF